MSARKKRKLNSKQPFAKSLEQHVEKHYEAFINNNNTDNMHLSPIRKQPRVQKGYITSPDKSTLSDTSHLDISNEELTRMYSDCIKLASENV